MDRVLCKNMQMGMNTKQLLSYDLSHPFFVRRNRERCDYRFCVNNNQYVNMSHK